MSSRFKVPLPKSLPSDGRAIFAFGYKTQSIRLEHCGHAPAPVVRQAFGMLLDKDLVRYCPECGHIGEVPEGSLNCCPDGSNARYVTKRIASQACAGFGEGG